MHTLAPQTSWHDLSHPISTGMPVYPGDPTVALSPAATIAADGYAVDRVSIGSQTGTHVDAPAHFIPAGKRLGDFAPETLMGQALLLDLRAAAAATAAGSALDATLLEGAPAAAPGRHILLCATGWDVHWGTAHYFEYPHFSADFAARVCELGYQVFGADTLSPDPLSGAASCHQILLSQDALIIENLRGVCSLLPHPTDTDTAGAPHRWVQFVALPLPLVSDDGAPIRALGRAL